MILEKDLERWLVKDKYQLFEYALSNVLVWEFY